VNDDYQNRETATIKTDIHRGAIVVPECLSADRTFRTAQRTR